MPFSSLGGCEGESPAGIESAPVWTLGAPSIPAEAPVPGTLLAAGKRNVSVYTQNYLGPRADGATIGTRSVTISWRDAELGDHDAPIMCARCGAGCACCTVSHIVVIMQRFPCRLCPSPGGRRCAGFALQYICFPYSRVRLLQVMVTMMPTRLMRATRGRTRSRCVNSPRGSLLLSLMRCAETRPRHKLSFLRAIVQHCTCAAVHTGIASW